AFLAGPLLRVAHGGDLRVGVGAAGDETVIDLVVVVAADPLDAEDGLVVGDVGEVGVAVAAHRHVGRPVHVDAVADGPDVLQVGAVLVVGLDSAALDLELGFGDGDAVGVAGDADRDEDDVGVDGAGLLAAEGEADAGLRLVDLVGPGLQAHVDAALGEEAFEDDADVVVLVGQEVLY